MTLAIGVDIGGTKVATGVVDDAGEILAQAQRPTAPGNAQATLEEVGDLITELRGQHTVGAVGVCTPGVMDINRSRVDFAANLGWVDVPVRDLIQTHTGLPTFLEGDANAAAWAEYRFGSGQDQSHLVMVTVGTGLGGGVIDEGSIRHGATGSASDIGHIPVVPDGVECECGGRGCLEQYASGRALVRQTRTLCLAQPSRAEDVLSLGDGTTDGLRGEHVTVAARRGDPLAVQAFQDVADWLGLGLAVLTAVLDPGCFVLGGGVSDAGELLLEPVRSSYERHLPVPMHRSSASLELALLGSDAGMVGAADLARAQLTAT